MNIPYTLHRGDCLSTLRAMPDNSVHCCVTSPPYYGLRDYGVDGQIGLEETPDEFIARLVEVFREVRRVLTDDGTLWLNIGDSYATRPYGQGHTFDPKYGGRNRAAGYPNRQPIEGVKHKDLIGIPWMLAFALRADGWYLRQEIIWNKPNAMPESVKDRCTKAHESVFLLAKSERYFFDADAIKEPAVYDGGQGSAPKGAFAGKRADQDGRVVHAPFRAVVEKRNKRSVWTVASRPYKGAHFATFPPDLIEPCILAGTSARGHCPACGARWVREVERNFIPQQDVSVEKCVRGHGDTKPMDASNTWQGFARGITRTVTVGWVSSCDCGLAPVPDVVLDPFGGTGTTAGVAVANDRAAVICELSSEYARLIPARVESILDAYGRQRQLFPGMA